MERSKRQKVDLNWLFLGRDVWREIFFYFTFDEIQKLRIVCTSWNLWILEYKPFWPINRELYYSLTHNIASGKYTQKEIKIPHKITKIKIWFGIVLINRSTDNISFRIYSKSSLELLYEHKESIQKLDFSGNHMIIEDTEGTFFLLTFEHITQPKESVRLISKTKVYENEDLNDYEFCYPFLLISYNILIDLRTNKDIVKEHKSLFPKEFTISSINENYMYLEYEEDEELKQYWIYDMNNLKEKSIVKTNDIDYDGVTCLDGNKFFYVEDRGKVTFVNCYHLSKHTKTTCLIKREDVYEVDSTFICFKKRSGSYDVYKWNDDHTQVMFYIEISPYSFKVNAFHNLFPCYTFFHGNGAGIKLSIHSKRDAKKLLEIPFTKKHSLITGDSDKRIFARKIVNKSMYLCVFDFS